MIKNQNHKSVIVEKIFDFEKAFSDLYEFEQSGPFWKPTLNYNEFRLFWERAYKNGNSTNMLNHLKYVELL